LTGEKTIYKQEEEKNNQTEARKMKDDELGGRWDRIRVRLRLAISVDITISLDTRPRIFEIPTFLRNVLLHLQGINVSCLLLVPS
jgi:hypothetical protein